MERDDVTVVLAHGAWADGSSWARVIARLRQDGVRTIAAPLPLTTLPDDVAALERTIVRATGAVVLAGHGYGGTVIGAARPERVKALAYIAGVAPDEGETAAQAAYRGEQHPLSPVLAPDGDGLVWLPHGAFANAFAPDASPDDQAVFAAVQRPISVACIGEPAPRPLWRDRASWYLLAEHDRMLSPANQRLMAEGMGASTVAHPVDHTPLASRPDLVAQLILAAIDGQAK